MIEFYTHPMSRGRIVHTMMEEIGQPYETHWLSWGPTGHKSPEYLAINPMGKVPAIRHNGHVVTEAAAIIMYLADVFPEAGLAPKASEKADYYRWVFFASGPAEQAMIAGSLGWTVPEGRESTVGFGSLDAVADALEGLLSTRPYVCGDRFTAADVYVGAQIGWALQTKVLPMRPSFGAYAQSIASRPANARAMAICDAKLAAGA
jgi:glutathione S-transferase